jgi:hypothetical protein
MRSSVAINSSSKLSLVGHRPPPTQSQLKVYELKEDIPCGDTKNKGSYLKKKIKHVRKKAVLSFDKRNE